MKKLHVTPTSLRIILSISLFVVIALSAALASISYTGLKNTAVEVSRTTLDADASQDNLRVLQELKQKLEDDQEIVNRANNIVAESKSYQYQDQIIADLNGYAGKAGLEIVNMDFSTTAVANTPTPNANVPSATLPPPSGVKSTRVSVTLKNPVGYLALLRFLQSIEQNLTKMQVAKVNLTKSPAGGVSSDALMIEVYVR